MTHKRFRRLFIGGKPLGQALADLEASDPVVRAAGERLDAVIADLADPSGRWSRSHRLPCQIPGCPWHRTIETTDTEEHHMITTPVDIIFDGPPGPESCKFVEVHYAETNQSLRLGNWIDRGDGTWALRFIAVNEHQDDGNFVEIYLGMDDQYHWRRKSANGKIVSVSGEGFTQNSYARASARSFSGCSDIRELT